MDVVTVLPKWMRWTQWVRSEVEAKLGRCSRCMRASLAGAAGAWALAAAVAAAGVPAVLVQLVALAGAGFSALVAAHALAYVVRPAPVGGPCCGDVAPRGFERRPVLRAVLSLPAAFGLAPLVRTGGSALAAPQRALVSPETDRTAEFRTRLSCPGSGTTAACQCEFAAFFGYDFERLSPTRIRVTRITMRWEQGGTGSCAAGIERGSGAFDFQCVGDSKVCKLTGGNIWSCACDTDIQFLPLGNSSEDDCLCPNEKNRKAYAQGVCGPPIWIQKECDFQWITVDFLHKVTCGCPNGHIERGFLTVVARYNASDGRITFGGDWVQGTGLP